MTFHSTIARIFGLRQRFAAGRLSRHHPQGKPGRSLRLEVLEERLAPAIALTYGGPDSSLSLVEISPGSTPLVTISEASPNLLTIELAGATFAGTSTASVPGLTYQVPGQPALSHSATIDIGAVNDITSLEANLLSDELTVGPIADSAGGLGNLVASAAAIDVDNVSLANASSGNGNVSLTASESLTVNGSLQAGTLSLTSALQMEIMPQANLAAQQGATGGQVQLSAPHLILDGSVSANGTSGGTVKVQADALVLDGAVTASGSKGLGGTITIGFTRDYIATQSALLDADGYQGGQVHVTGTGRLFTSGTMTARGNQPFSTGGANSGGGGQVMLTSTDIVLDVAAVDVSGTSDGGSVVIGGVPKQATTTQRVTATAGTVIHADATVNGQGGDVQFWSNVNTEVAATVGVRGGVQSGAGGMVEVSSAGSDSFTGSLLLPRLSSKNAETGTLLMDPRNLVISAAKTSVLPQYQLIDPGTGSGFGATLVPLSTGNVVVADDTDNTMASGAGAVYLFDGQSGALIGMLSGSSANDKVGSLGMTLLSNGNYIVDSPEWNDGRGAVTLVSGSTGTALLDGATNLSSTDSLVGSNPGTQGDQVGSAGVRVLSNGNYVVDSSTWNDYEGAVTLVSGSTGKALVDGTTVVSLANSLTGSTGGADADQVGDLVTPLSNGNYVVDSPSWNRSEGAVTLVNGSTGKALVDGSTVVSSTNSLTGSNSNDHVGSRLVTVLSNGNYIVDSPEWNGREGAVTLVNGRTGKALVDGTTAVSSVNSLTGSTGGTQSDSVGFGGVTALSNGNYVVNSPGWNNNEGAITLVSGHTGRALVDGTTAVSSANSITGSTAGSSGDQVGFSGVTALSNGNYVVDSRYWNDNVGAVTLVSGSTGTAVVDGSTVVSSANSLTGSNGDDEVGFGGVTALSNGNYVVDSSAWNDGRGAVTLMNGSTGKALVDGTTTISGTNSLVGSHPGIVGDQVGYAGVTVLSNGNYVVDSSAWNGSRGAVTLMSGSTGTALVDGTTVVSFANSLTGSNSDDEVGVDLVSALGNGNYVVDSSSWNGGRGAVTLMSGSTGKALVDGTTTVSSANSLTGSNAGDHVGSGVAVLSDGSYLVVSPDWKADTGAVTLVSGSTGLPLDGSHTITTDNSIIGDNTSAGLASNVENTVNHTFLAGFTTDANSGIVKVGLTSQTAYATTAGQDFAITPDLLTQILDSGADVVLQASNDITLSGPINVSAGGHGGNLTLEAGRSILLNASISTDNGNLTLIANDTLADGVIDFDRADGAAVITMAPGTGITAGSGSVAIDLRNGTGKTYTSSGDITLQGISAGSLSISSEGPSAGSDIDLAGPLNAGLGDVNLLASSGSILAASDGADIATTGTVTLDATRSIGTATNRIPFDAVSSPTGVLIGATYEAGSVFLDGRGNLTLSEIFGGAANTSVDVTARGNLTVAADAVIDSGSGTISLGADLTASGAGDDGVGTLNIVSGALVLSSKASSNAITLRGADMNIQGIAHSGVVLGAFSSFASGLNTPYGLAFDAAGNLYVADEIDGTVLQVPAGGGVATTYASGFSLPTGLAFDTVGNLYVADGRSNTVFEVPAGGGTPIAYASGLAVPEALAFDSAGNLYVADTGDGTVSKVPAGGGTPTTYASGLNFPTGLAFDAAGNLYVASAGDGTVSKIPAGGGPPTTYASGLNAPFGLAFDAAGNLYVADTGDGTVSKIASGGGTPTAFGTGLRGLRGLAFDAAGKLYVSDYFSGSVFKATTGSGSGVAIETSVKTLPMSIGGTDNAVDGVNLTDAELAHIVTDASGMITFGDARQAGDLTFVTATTATAPGASTVVLQATDGPGMILLDERFLSKAVNTNGGPLSLTAGASGIHVINPARNVYEVLTTTAPANQTALEGISTAFAVGSFADAGTTDGGWMVTVNWGDGTASSTFGEDGPGTIDPQPHTYAAGRYTATVTVTNDCGLTSNTSSFQVVVSDPPVTIESVSGFQVAQGFATGLEEVGEFTDPGNPTGLVHPVSGYSVNVNWGDGSKDSILSSPANIAYMGEDANGNGIFSVLASHAYLTSGVFNVNMSVTDGGNTTVGPTQTTTATVPAPATPSQTITISDAPLTTPTDVATNLPSSSLEGQAFGAIADIAEFTETAGMGKEALADFVAIINWGDGSTSPDTVALKSVSSSGATYQVNAPGHTYANEGTYSESVSVVHDGLAPVTSAGQSIVVAGQQISQPVVAVIFATAGASTGPITGVATFSDPGMGTNDPVSHFTASINWGDGSATDVSTGANPSVTIVSLGNGQYRVDSTTGHTYGVGSASARTVTVTVTHDALPSVKGTNKAVVSLAAPIVTATDAGGPANGKRYPASARAVGTDGTTSVNGSFSFSYYLGNSVSGAGSATAPTSAGSYMVVAHFTSNDSRYSNADSAPISFSITKATHSVIVTDLGGVYDGSAFAGKATVNGGVSLEGVRPTLAYYIGTLSAARIAKATPLTGAPSVVGSYTVVANFAGSTDYSSASSAPVHFSITRAKPTVSLSNVSTTYTGPASAGTATVNGAASLEGVSPTLVYYLGRLSAAQLVGATPLPGAPSKAGNYTVVAKFAGSADYTSAFSTPFYVTFEGQEEP